MPNCRLFSIVMLLGISSWAFAQESQTESPVPVSTEMEIAANTPNRQHVALQEALTFAIQQAQPFGQKYLEVHRIAGISVGSPARLYHGEQAYQVQVQYKACPEMEKHSFLEYIRVQRCWSSATFSCVVYQKDLGNDHKVFEVDYCSLGGGSSQYSGVMVESLPSSDSRLQLVRLK